MRKPPSHTLQHPSIGFMSFESACEYLFFYNSSPKNIFHLLFTQKKDNPSRKKFGIFINLLSQGADFNIELAENDDLANELVEYFAIEVDEKPKIY